MGLQETATVQCTNESYPKQEYSEGQAEAEQVLPGRQRQAAERSSVQVRGVESLADHGDDIEAVVGGGMIEAHARKTSGLCKELVSKRLWAWCALLYQSAECCGPSAMVCSLEWDWPTNEANRKKQQTGLEKGSRMPVSALSGTTTAASRGRECC